MSAGERTFLTFFGMKRKVSHNENVTEDFPPGSALPCACPHSRGLAPCDMPSGSRCAVMLKSACAELVSTEESYVETLTTIVTVVLRPLRTWALEEGDAASAVRNGGVTSDEINVLFGSVETLLKVNSDMLEQLRPGDGEAGPEPTQLAMTMATWAAGPLRMYAPHVARFPAVCALLSRLLARRVRFKAAVRVLELQPVCRGLTLQALLVSTVQRLPRYTLLLKEILTHCTAECGLDGVDAVRSTLQLALDKIKEVTVGVDRSVDETNRRNRAMEVCRKILKRDDLVASHRTLIKEGALTKLRPARGPLAFEARKHESRREAYLFSDIVVLLAAADPQGASPQITAHSMTFHDLPCAPSSRGSSGCISTRGLHAHPNTLTPPPLQAKAWPGREAHSYRGACR